MWPFTRKPTQPRRTVFYDPLVEEIRDPAAREWASRVLGLINQLEGRVAFVENNLHELRERLTWTSQLDGSPFTEGDRIARGIAAGVPVDGAGLQNSRRLTDAIEHQDRAAREAPEEGK